MAINPQNKKDAEEIRELVQDTLISISKAMSEAIRVSVEEAVDGVDAKIKDTLGKDLTRSMTSLAKASKDSANNLYRIREGLLSSRDISKQLTAIDEKRLTLAREVLLAKRNGVPVDQEQLTAINKVLKEEKKLLLREQQKVKDIEKQIGLTGKLISSISKIPGLGQFVDAKEIETEMRKVAARGGNTFQTMGVAASMVGKQLRQGLLDPLTLITAIWNGFMRVDEAATEFTRITGQNTSAISSMNSSLASTVDILEVASNLSKEIGVAGNNFISPEQLAAVAETKNLLGLSAEQATKLAIQTKISGQNVDTFKKNVMAGVKQSNLQNKTGVEYGVVFKDILDTSEDVTMSLGNNPKKLAAAATAARAFGLTLQQVNDIASSLLNFEDSIGNELEAQLLTGNRINLSKARELALNNDLEGVANELAKNGASAAEFSAMNRIQQEALAKALGMSREQLGKSVLAQQASKDLTDKQRAAIMGMSEAEYERMTVQDRIQKSLDKIAQAFAPILEKFVIPIVEGLTTLLNLPLVPYFIAGLVVVRSLGGGILNMTKGMLDFGKSILGAIKNFDLLAIKQKLFGGASKATTTLPSNTGTPTSTGGVGSIVNSVQKINPTKLLAGASALVIAAGAMFILGKAMQQFQGIGIETYLGAGAALLGLTLALAGLSMLSGPVLLGAASLLVGAAAIYVLGKALQEVGKALPLIAEGMGLIFPMLIGLSQALLPLIMLGPALFGIAAGLSAVSLAGLAALPAIGGLVMLSKAAPALVSLGVGGDNKTVGEGQSTSSNESFTKIEERLAELVAIVKQGGDVYMDSNKIGKAMVLGTYKSS